jgi:hypothetical protein
VTVTLLGNKTFVGNQVNMRPLNQRQIGIHGIRCKEHRDLQTNECPKLPEAGRVEWNRFYLMSLRGTNSINTLILDF